MSWGGGGGRLAAGGLHGDGYNQPHHQQQQVGVGVDVGVQEVIARALETCETHHQFIASQAEHLERLRSQCATSAQLTQQEIRTLEVSPALSLALGHPSTPFPPRCTLANRASGPRPSALEARPFTLISPCLTLPHLHVSPLTLEAGPFRPSFSLSVFIFAFHSCPFTLISLIHTFLCSPAVCHP